MTVGTRIQVRRDTAADWLTNDPVLLQGEIGLDETNNLIKVGDGSTAWSLLPVAFSGTFVQETQSLAGRDSVNLTTVHTRADDTTTLTLGKDSLTGKLYGIVAATTHFCTSTDGTTWTVDANAAFTYWGTATQFMVFTPSYMYHATSDGRIFRAPKDNFAGWVNISAPCAATTTGRVADLAVSGDGAVLLYTNYDPSTSPYSGAFLWRSTDNGTTWTEVVSLPDPQARHGHAVRFDPWRAGDAYWMVGDDPGTGTTWQQAGLYKSSDYGATWSPIYLVSDRQAAGVEVGCIGIDMVFPPPTPGVPDMVLFEGDDSSSSNPTPLILVHYKDTLLMQHLVWPTGATTDAEYTGGTVRGIGLTPNNDCVFFTTTESGVAGKLAGIYVLKAPLYTEAILLEDITGAEPPGYCQTVFSPTQTQQRSIRFNTPNLAH